ncbi:hypothetical protein ACH5RR_004873 [Cinchona calisaya]|uniref:Uncharacterized protein n=1 Tax=Cinchona calisaya TaxID=153742 RepID=A0ABD3AZS0_9GENT
MIRKLSSSRTLREGLHLHFNCLPIFSTLQPTTTHANSPVKKRRKPSRVLAPIEQPALVGYDDVGSKHEGKDVYSQQGLLEDVVPFLIRNPLVNGKSVNSSCSSSFPSPPNSPPSAPDYSTFIS